ncbi:MAG: hypothetical protein ACOVMM_00115 [Chitinophagaceae bacterium]
MIKKFKIYILFSVVILTLFSFTATSPTKSFGKSYNSNKDFTCCKGNQLVVHHFYVFRLFGIKTHTGYTEEAVGKPNVEGCNIQCLD